MIVPIYLLSGFLGSGKTTLLTQMIDQAKGAGLTPAVLMNELGEVNFDGQLVKKDVAMAEVLGGCICCSMKGDLSLELYNLLKQYKPDLIIVESTGAAHPMESIDAITETSLLHQAVLQEVITVVDSEHLLARAASKTDKTLRLMKDQIRCASRLLLNKVDKLEQEQKIEVTQLARELNAHAVLTPTIQCKLDDWQWLLKPELDAGFATYTAAHDEAHHHELAEAVITADNKQADEVGHHQDAHHAGEYSEHQDTRHDDERIEHQDTHHAGEHSDHKHTHHSHMHVMAYTHYWKQAPHSEQFEAWLEALPENIYRAKGIVTFRDIPSRFMFQYAYRESDFMRIDPQGDVFDVAVFIGEHFDAGWLKQELEKLESSV